MTGLSLCQRDPARSLDCRLVSKIQQKDWIVALPGQSRKKTGLSQLEQSSKKTGLLLCQQNREKRLYYRSLRNSAKRLDSRVAWEIQQKD